MAVVVEHEKRRADILEKALAVFAEEGYADVTYQKIADRCGITRTTLYHYFKDKREIFILTIRQFMDRVEKDLHEIMKRNFTSYAKQLKAVILFIVGICSEHRKLLTVILTYLLQLRKTGADPEERIRRRTLRWRHLFSRILIDGQKNGEFPGVSIKDANNLFYSLLESAVFHIAVLNTIDSKGIAGAVELAVDRLSGAGCPDLR